MFVRTKYNTKSGKTAVQLVENKRINDKVIRLLCRKPMKYRVSLNCKRMPGAINRCLQSLQTSIVIDIKTKKRYAMPSYATQDGKKKIYQIFGLKWKTTPYEIKKNQ